MGRFMPLCSFLLKTIDCCCILVNLPTLFGLLGGALSAVRAWCGRSATIWASSRTGDPYFVILGASLLPLA